MDYGLPEIEPFTGASDYRDVMATLLAEHARVGITGAPRTGKSMLSKHCGDREVIGTDSFKACSWEDIPRLMLARVEGLDRFLIEGVMVPRAMRKGLELDCVIVLTRPRVQQTKGQIAMGKSVYKWLEDALRMRPTKVVTLR